MPTTSLSFVSPAGTFTCDPSTAGFTIDRLGILGGTGRINKTRNIWTIHGRVNGTTASAVDAQVVALESVLMDGLDVIFSLGSSMNLLSRNCTEGTHIKKFTWNQGLDGVRGCGAEGVLRRTFEMIVYGDVLQISDTDIIAWQEHLTVMGSGGQHIVPVTSIAGGVQPQKIKNWTPIWVTQAGFARGLTDYPTAPLPIFLATPNVYYDPHTIGSTKMSPTSWGINRNTGWGIRWNYRAWSSLSTLSGTPGSF